MNDTARADKNPSGSGNANLDTMLSRWVHIDTVVGRWRLGAYPTVKQAFEDFVLWNVVNCHRHGRVYNHSLRHIADTLGDRQADRPTDDTGELAVARGTARLHAVRCAAGSTGLVYRTGKKGNWRAPWSVRGLLRWNGTAYEHDGNLPPVAAGFDHAQPTAGSGRTYRQQRQGLPPLAVEPTASSGSHQISSSIRTSIHSLSPELGADGKAKDGRKAGTAAKQAGPGPSTEARRVAAAAIAAADSLLKGIVGRQGYGPSDIAFSAMRHLGMSAAGLYLSRRGLVDPAAWPSLASAAVAELGGARPEAVADVWRLSRAWHVDNGCTDAWLEANTSLWAGNSQVSWLRNHEVRGGASDGAVAAALVAMLE